VIDDRELPRLPEGESDRKRAEEEFVAQEEMVKKVYLNALRNAERSFVLSLRINIIIVIVGIVLLAYSIIYSVFNGLGFESTALAGVGVADFVAIFWLNPQKKIQEALANNTKVQITYNRYMTQRELILSTYADYSYRARYERLAILEGMEKFMKALDDIGAKAINEIKGGSSS
jgi:hypothetical protein